jgi:hypothetical protein
MTINKEHAKERILELKADTERAKQIILQILKEAGGSLGKTKLFKAFWLSHLFYTKARPGYLSTWKIVRLPYGPGIHKGDSLILDLKKTSKIQLDHEPRGPYTETVCKLISEADPTGLPEGSIEAIQAALKTISGESATSISDWSHDFSRSWNTTPNGKELDIYNDLIPDDVYEERNQVLQEMNEAYDDLFR